MKKIVSVMLTAALGMAALPLTLGVSASAQYPDIVVSPAQLNLNVDQNASMTRTVTTYDGVSVLRVVPNRSSDDNLVVDGYNIKSRGMTLNDYRYAYMDYFFDSDADGTFTPAIGLLKPLNYNMVSATGAVVKGQWARAIFDMNDVLDKAGISAENDPELGQYHLYFFGRGVRGRDVDGTLYVSRLVFTDTMPGVPILRGLIVSPKTAQVYRGYGASFAYTADGENDPIVTVSWSLEGNNSSATTLTDGILSVAADETATELTIRVCNTKDPSMYDEATVTVTDRVLPKQQFDENNIILTFGVTSDTHLSGSWNQQRSVGKLGHMVDVFQKQAKAEGVKLDAILIAGDLVDGLANNGSNVQATSSYGLKAAQNYREVSYIRSVWEGKDTNRNDKNVKDAGGSTTAALDFGPGLYGTETKIFYALGNHDEGGKGIGVFNKEMNKGVRGDTGFVNTVYSAEYFAAIFCGWEYNYKTAKAQTSDDGYDDEYLDYIARVYQMFLDKDDAASLNTDKAEFAAKYAYITPEAALERFEFYYGTDTDFSRDDFGLFYGNRHIKLGDCHFIAIELSQNARSSAYLDKWCAESVKEDPTKPIFVITHKKMKDTVYASQTETGSDEMEAVLNKYPQCIVWGGHTHTSLTAENAIMQTGFTEVESAVLSALAMQNVFRKDISSWIDVNYNNHRVPDNQLTHENHKQGVCCWVQVDKDHNVRIKRLDVYRSYAADTDFDGVTFNHTDFAIFQKEPWIISGTNAAGDHLFFYSKARANNPAPYFPNGAKATHTPIVSGGTKVMFDAAIDDDQVKYYFVEAVDNATGTVAARKLLTSYFADCKDQAEMLSLHPSYQCSFSGLDDSKDYTIRILAFDVWDHQSEPFVAAVDDSSVYIYRIDGKYCAFVDTTGRDKTYTYEGKTYNVFDSLAEAVESGAQRVYLIRGTNSLSFFTKYKQALEIVGIERDNAVFEYTSSLTMVNNLTLRNLTLDKQNSGDAGITLQGHTLVLDSVKSRTNALNLFNSGWGKGDPSGTLIIRGDTSDIKAFFPGPNYSETAYSKGDVTLKIEGGTFSGTFGDAKNKAAEEHGNRIEGNVFYDISGGTFSGPVKAPTANIKTSVTKNVVIRISGGTFSGKIGHTGTSYVGGKEVYVFNKDVYEACSPLYQASNEAILITYDGIGGIGDATFDENGYITGFHIKQVQNCTSFVNGTKATAFAVEAGQTYKVTYAATLPDLNDDGAETFADVQTMMKRLSGQNVTIDTDKADLDGDGRMTLRDLNRLMALIKLFFAAAQP